MRLMTRRVVGQNLRGTDITQQSNIATSDIFVNKTINLQLTSCRRTDSHFTTPPLRFDDSYGSERRHNGSIS
jgi:hypothetical protein